MIELTNCQDTPDTEFIFTNKTPGLLGKNHYCFFIVYLHSKLSTRQITTRCQEGGIFDDSITTIGQQDPTILLQYVPAVSQCAKISIGPVYSSKFE